MQKITSLVIILLFLAFPKGLLANLDSLLLALEKESDKNKRTSLLLEIGSEQIQQNHFRSALNYLFKADAAATKLKDLTQKKRAKALIGQAYYELGQLDSAQIHLEENLALNEALEDEDGLLNAYNNLALVYHYRLQFDKTLEMYQLALSIAEKKKDKEGIALLNSNMGIIFGQQGNVEKALDHFQLSLEVAQEADEQRLVQNALTNIGRAHIENQNYKEAIKYLQQALELADQQKDITGKASVLDFLGMAALNQKQFELAQNYYSQALEIYKASEAQARIAEVYGKLAKLYGDQGENAKAFEYGKEALKIAEAIQLNEVCQEVYFVLSQSATEMGDYAIATSYLNKYIGLRDSLFNERSSQQLAEMQTKYETEKKEAENELLRLKAAQDEAKIRQQNLLNIATGIIVLLACLLAFFYYKNYQQKLAANQTLEEEVKNRTEELVQANDQLSQSNAELKSFAYIASHDLKEPLRNINSYTGLIEHHLGEKLDEEALEYMKMVKLNTRQMYELIEDVLAYTTLTEENEAVDEEVDLNKVVSQIKESLNKMIQDKSAVIKSTALPKIKGNFAQFYLILKNLIENGIKYNESTSPTVEITWSPRGDQQRISVSDNGIGIDPKYHQKIFGMFKRLHNRNNYSGTGIGLAICYKIAKRLGGEISIDSTENKGSTFHLDFPS
jgi:signal transduction histidine kinase/Tfp pilus assembly protein PilF